MVDGTGMCGACRVEVAGETKFACTDGPEFDGHDVDFGLLMARQKMYLEEEKLAMDEFKRNPRPKVQSPGSDDSAGSGGGKCATCEAECDKGRNRRLKAGEASA